MVMMMTRKKYQRKNKKVILIIITKKENENNWDTLDKLIEGCPYKTYPVDMEEGVKNEYGDGKEITAENEYEGEIHRYITENEKETNRYTLDKVIEGFPVYTSPVEMEEGVNNEDD